MFLSKLEYHEIRSDVLNWANLKSNHLASKLATNGIVCSYRSERPPFWLVVTAFVVPADPQWVAQQLR